MVTRHFPWLLQAFNRFPHKIMRADFARFLYMSKYGGVYVDLDSECLRPLDSLLPSIAGAALGRMSDNPDLHAIPNAFFASEPAHPFWDFCIATSLQRSSGPHIKRAPYTMTAPEHVTGPAALQVALDAFVRNGRGVGRTVTLLPPGVVYPIDWGLEKSEPWVSACIARRVGRFDGAVCKEWLREKWPDAYMATYWARSWAET
ncbi:MAG: hypothetical protein WDW36_007544 [Sanguina aurantia]